MAMNAHRPVLRNWLRGCLLGLAMQSAGAADPMRVVYFDDYEPISWSASAVMRGVLIDIVDEATARMGLAVEHRGYPWARAQEMVRGGFADAFLTVVTDERNEYTIVGDEDVLSLDIAAYTGSGNPRRTELERIQTLNDLKPYVLASYVGNGWTKKRLTEHQLHWVSNISTVLRLVRSGRADVFIDTSQVVRYYVHKLNFDADIVELPPIFESVKFRLCINKNSPYAARIAQFDLAILSMRKDGTLDRIYDRYQITRR